jgi:hypothetical protein
VPHLTYLATVLVTRNMWRQMVRDRVEVGGRGLTEILSRHFPGEIEENHKISVRIVRVQPDTQTKDLIHRRQTLIFS